MTVNYKISKVGLVQKPRIGIREEFKLFNYTLVEEFEEDPAYLVLYTYLAQTNLYIAKGNPAQFLYSRLGNLPADKNMRFHVDGLMKSLHDYDNKVFAAKNIFPSSAAYTFVNPRILIDTNTSAKTKARYIKAVKNLSLRRRLVGGKLIVPADYIEEDVTGIPGISTKDGKVRFNLEEKVNIKEERQNGKMERR